MILILFTARRTVLHRGPRFRLGHLDSKELLANKYIVSIEQFLRTPEFDERSVARAKILQYDLAVSSGTNLRVAAGNEVVFMKVDNIALPADGQCVVVGANHDSLPTSGKELRDAEL